MKLLSVELRRFAARRANVVVAVVGLLFLAGTLAILGVNSHQPTPAEIDRAEQQAQRERDSEEQQLEECQRYWRDHPDADPDAPDPADFPDGRIEDYGYDADCEMYYGPEGIDASQYLGNVLSFAEEAPTQVGFLGLVFIVCALLMAGSFVGAEWTSGGMTNLLLWRPRRLPVFAAKLGAVLLWVLGLTLVTSALHLGGLYLIARTRGEVGELTASWWTDNLVLGGRLLALVAVAVVVGFTLSMIGRRTVVALGAVVGYVVLVEYVLRGMLYMVDLVRVEYWMLSTYVIAWVAGGNSVYSGMDGAENFVGQWHGGGVVLAVTGVLLAISATLFARRDAD